MAFSFSNYFVFMFLAISLLTIFGSLGAALMYNYDVETSSDLDNYLNQFDASTYADENTLTVEKQGFEGSGEFSAYESSFRFGDQVKTTGDQTTEFVKATSSILGLPPIVWYIISGVLFILLLITIIYFLRGIMENR